MAEKVDETPDTNLEETPALDLLESEGADLENEPDGEDTDEGGDDSGGEGDGESVAALAARLETLEANSTKKDDEIAYLRGELRKANTQAPAKKDDEPLFDMDELVAQLTNKDPKVAAKAVVELAQKIADQKITAERERTANLVRDSDSVRSAKEQDRANVLEAFEEDLNDPAFVDALRDTFSRTQRSTGGRYVPDSLFQAASTVKLMRDRANAAKAGTKKGVKEVRPNRIVANTTLSGGDDYSKVTTISAIPDHLMSPREKNIARATAKKMGTPEKDWVKNFMDEVKNGRAA